MKKIYKNVVTYSSYTDELIVKMKIRKMSVSRELNNTKSNNAWKWNKSAVKTVVISSDNRGNRKRRAIIYEYGELTILVC